MTNPTLYSHHLFPVWVNFESRYLDDGWYAVPSLTSVPDAELSFGEEIEELPEGLVFLSDREDEAWRVLAMRAYQDDFDPAKICRIEFERDVAWNNETWLVLTDDEADVEWEDRLMCLGQDCEPGWDSPYFDRERWLRDVKVDHRANRLAPFDGREDYVHLDEGRTYMLYRQN